MEIDRISGEVPDLTLANASYRNSKLPAVP